MPPEQARGEIGTLDERSDVFALGGILCEILTGRPPFNGRDDEETKARAAAGDVGPAHARLLESGTDPELAGLAIECLSALPEGRPPDARAVAVRLQGHLAGLDERARASEIALAEARARERHVRRNRRLAVALLACILAFACMGFAVVLWLQRNESARSKRTAEELRHAMETASALRERALAGSQPDAQAWSEALFAAERARSVARTGKVDAVTMDEVTALVSEVEAGLAMALAAAWREAENERLVRLIDETRMLRASGAVFDEQDAAFAAIFSEIGLDTGNLAIERNLAVIAESAIRATLVRGLDVWAMLRFAARRPLADSWKAVLALAIDGDPDPLRGSIRKAFRDGDVAALKRFLERPDLAGLPLMTLALLADAVGIIIGPASAIDVFESARRTHPDDFRVNFGLAYALASLGETRRLEAIRAYGAALAVLPGSPLALHNLATLYLEAGELDVAKRIFEDVVLLKPDLALAHANLGIVAFRQDDLARSEAALREAIRLDGRRAGHWANLGRTLYAARRFAEAVACFEESLRRGRAPVAARLDLAMAASEAGDPEKSETLLREVIAEEADNAEAHRLLGSLFVKRGDARAAIASLRRSLEIDPRSVSARLDLTGALAATGDLDGGIAELRTILRTNPNHARAHANLGWLLARKGDYVSALESYRVADELDPSEGEWKERLRNFVQQAERLKAVEDRAKATLDGIREPASTAEWRELLTHARNARRDATEARLWAKALDACPEIVAGPAGEARTKAAEAAARAAVSTTGDLAEAWRRRGISWLTEELDSLSEARRDGRLSQTLLRRILTGWEASTDLQPLRPAPPLEAESHAVEDPRSSFWQRVEEALDALEG
jgi:serine/threonine-protein kinase